MRGRRAGGTTPRPWWRNQLAEFTGERVIPGRVDVDLLNEHLARYAFAARLADAIKGWLAHEGVNAHEGCAHYLRRRALHGVAKVAP